MSSPMALTDRFASAFAATAGALPLALLARRASRPALPLRPAGRAEPGLRPRRRRIHARFSRNIRTTATPACRSSAPSCAPRWITTTAAGGSTQRRQARRGAGRVADRLRAEPRPAATSKTRCASVRTQLRTKVAVAREGKTQLETLIERVARSAAARHRPARRRRGCRLRSSSATPARATSSPRSAASPTSTSCSIRRSAISRSRSTCATARSKPALQAWPQSTRNFYHVTAQRTITVIPDTPAKRREYEEEVVRTFYLSNADLKETIDLLRIVVDARRIAPITATNAITIKDTPERVAAAATHHPRHRQGAARGRHRRRAARSRSHAGCTNTACRSRRPALADRHRRRGRRQPRRPDAAATCATSSQSDVFLTNLPALYYRLLKSDTNTRTLANPQLRTSEGMAAQARFGERVPVPVTTFAPIATGGVAQQPITSFNYENIGVNIDITPRTHHDDEVSLALKIEVSSISGTGLRRAADVRQPRDHHGRSGCRTARPTCSPA